MQGNMVAGLQGYRVAGVESTWIEEKSAEN
jgi:hypothetical protein